MRGHESMAGSIREVRGIKNSSVFGFSQMNSDDASLVYIFSGLILSSKSNSATTLKTSSLGNFPLKALLLRISPLKKPLLETSSLLRQKHLTTESFHNPRKGISPPSSSTPIQS
jgi:hypothetical protein